jgi:hypothetical protein
LAFPASRESGRKGGRPSKTRSRCYKTTISTCPRSATASTRTHVSQEGGPLDTEDVVFERDETSGEMRMKVGAFTVVKAPEDEKN